MAADVEVNAADRAHGGNGTGWCCHGPCGGGGLTQDYLISLIGQLSGQTLRQSNIQCLPRSTPKPEESGRRKKEQLIQLELLLISLVVKNL